MSAWVRSVSKPWRVTLALVAAGPVMAVVIGAQRYFVGRLRGDSVDWVDFLSSHASFWIAWAIVGRLVVPIVLRLIAGSQRRVAKAAMLIGLCVVVVTLQPALDILQRMTVLPPRIDAPLLDTFTFFQFAPLPHNVLVFGRDRGPHVRDVVLRALSRS
jgi:hypothetical protein